MTSSLRSEIEFRRMMLERIESGFEAGDNNDKRCMNIIL